MISQNSFSLNRRKADHERPVLTNLGSPPGIGSGESSGKRENSQSHTGRRRFFFENLGDSEPKHKIKSAGSYDAAVCQAFANVSTAQCTSLTSCNVLCATRSKCPLPPSLCRASLTGRASLVVRTCAWHVALAAGELPV